jgi:hypothetical protein
MLIGLHGVIRQTVVFFTVAAKRTSKSTIPLIFVTIFDLLFETHVGIYYGTITFNTVRLGRMIRVLWSFMLHPSSTVKMDAEENAGGHNTKFSGIDISSIPLH